MKLIRIASFLSLGFGLLLCSGIIFTGANAGAGRNIPEDGLQPDQTILATWLGYERDLQCHWGDDGERSLEECKTCDDGAYHPHWVCPEDAVVLRPIPGRMETPTAGYEGYLKYGPGYDNAAILLLIILGIGGLAVTNRDY